MDARNPLHDRSRPSQRKACLRRCPFRGRQAGGQARARSSFAWAFQGTRPCVCLFVSNTSTKVDVIWSKAPRGMVLEDLVMVWVRSYSSVREGRAEVPFFGTRDAKEIASLSAHHEIYTGLAGLSLKVKTCSDILQCTTYKRLMFSISINFYFYFKTKSFSSHFRSFLLLSKPFLNIRTFKKKRKEKSTNLQ